jgi:hypothetical protein
MDNSQGEVFTHHSLVCRIDFLACQDEFFVNNLLDVKENGEHALDFAFHSSRLFWSQ